MEIIYLKDLNYIPIATSLSDNLINKKLTLSEISALEQEYNQGNLFPNALRELLFLAGKYCYILDYGIYDSQLQMQQAERNYLQLYNKIITRPFYVIDVYNDGDQFLFVYLDDGNNPTVYSAELFANDSSPYVSLKKTLSEYVSSRIADFKRGQNPF